ncbi:scarecrow-like protein 9 [Telopea speciosissima]|uniref:scarecrow-like protein 9 n=1 Tax=Telopea speciosissima TaxID=54955 RepID=UPI001CC69069|nr:scarecrow-like protein 9 [Telopea speciosissima]
MIMDPCLAEFSVPVNGFRVDDQSGFYQNLGNGLKLEQPFDDCNLMDLPLLPPNADSSGLLPAPPPTGVIHEEDSPEDCDFSDVVLNYINQMLMEEEMEEKTCMFQESSALQAAEKSLYEVLGQKYPPSPDQHPLYYDQETESPDDFFTSSSSNSISSGNSHSSNTLDSSLTSDLGEHKPTWTDSIPADYTSQSTSYARLGFSNGVTSAVDGFVEPPVSRIQFPDLFSEIESVTQFRKGVEEASKFLPNGNNLFLNLEKRGVFPRSRNEPKEELLRSEPKKELRRRESKEEILRRESKEEHLPPIKVETKDEREYSPTGGSKGRKHLHGEESDLEVGRSTKQSAVYTEATERTDMFDMVLLCHPGGKGESPLYDLREALQNGLSKNGQSNGPSGGKTRGKKQVGKKEVVDLRTLLIHCAQSVAADDRRSVNELLKQIRQHSTPYGDGNQRLAHYFAEGIEARLAGTGRQLYMGVSSLRTSAADVLKAYHLFLAMCPFKKISNFFSNRTILNASEKATRLHIVDFGILYGFQWPSLIEILSKREGGPPKLRITGIELPQPGFRPSARVEETGKRLANYAKTFNVPFEYNAIAQKWETIQLEDLKIDRDEVLVVNCLYRLRNILDETVVVDSPRNAVLNLIRRMNPAVFVHGVLNGAYSAPFFVTRFRETLFHFSALFDMLETNVPRELEERMLIERDLLAREAINVISCEGSERLERPETYKQWQVRNLRAGLKQLPLNPEMMKKARDRVKSCYHKDFVIDQDGHWLLQGWKGRIIYAISTWKPAYDS